MAIALNKLLQRAGISIAKTETAPGRVIVLLRVAKDSFWNETMSEFLLASVGQPWSTDVSKWFYVDQTNNIRFLWRVVLQNDVKAASEALGAAAVRAVQSSVEVVSQPLVGRKDYPFDPASGKMMGAHDAGTASKALAVATSTKS